jgi:hypothetical protein
MPQLALQQCCPVGHVVLPQVGPVVVVDDGGGGPDSQNCWVQAPSGGAQMPQLALQQVSPPGHTFVPHTAASGATHVAFPPTTWQTLPPAQRTVEQASTVEPRALQPTAPSTTVHAVPTGHRMVAHDGGAVSRTSMGLAATKLPRRRAILREVAKVARYILG